jgi:hypothetical protein
MPESRGYPDFGAKDFFDWLRRLGQSRINAIAISCSAGAVVALIAAENISEVEGTQKGPDTVSKAAKRKLRSWLSSFIPRDYPEQMSQSSQK